ncbi:excinuclease ABC subunit C [bacterium]|nr:excinuclease ABC subunit C [bacterium]
MQKNEQTHNADADDGGTIRENTELFHMKEQGEQPLSLTSKLDLLPRRPGCYIFKDENGKIIYIGKAKVLRNRVRSYFTSRDDGRYLYPLLVSRIRDVEIIVTETEVEALILEANLIRRHRPRFNMDVRDDRTYPYLKVTREPFPRIFLTRKPGGGRARYYGPLSDVTRVKDTLNALKQACHIRTCNLKITDESIRQKKHKVCLEYHIGNCMGPCEGLVDENAYTDGVQRLVDVVHGRTAPLKDLLEQRMREHAKGLRYELAARTRDQIQALGNLSRQQTVVSLSEEERDVFGLAREDKDGCITVLRIRQGKLIGRHHAYLSRLSEHTDDGEIQARYLAEYYMPETRAVPAEVHVPGPLSGEQHDVLEAFLTEKRGKKCVLHTPQRGKGVRQMEMAAKNAELLLKEHRLAKEKRERVPLSLVELHKHLNLDDLPWVIECFDNSNLMGSHPVSSMVRFRNARPEKSQYRRYKVKGVEGPDDFASMREVVGRRYRRLLRESAALPDLVLIDGGIGQVNAARRELDEIGLNHLPVVGLAKRLEEIVSPFDGGVLQLPKTSSALKLLMQLRDEAHRFAITYHRKLRTGALISSTLTSLPGVGDAKAKALLKHFGSLKNLKNATPDEIAKVPGFSVAGGRRVLELLGAAEDENGELGELNGTHDE